MVAYEKVKKVLIENGRIQRPTLEEIAGEHALSIYLDLKNSEEVEEIDFQVNEASQIPMFIKLKR
ncbi:hypothetical protein ACFS7Z_18620 [Pontibacter toksunensis]|uniref:Uncharacterized protein n=1 Tax=Pontibacter toksunensis TaxID=1332631 RepID=A0ABW6BZQ1_9BACT